MTSSEMTPADIAAVTGNRGNGGFGNGDGFEWIVILFLFAMFGGWGGRGGYGGYGGYGYGSNYYNYMAMAAYASGYYSDSEAETSVELDKDRFYNCTLNGPESAGARPQLKFTFSAPKTAE